MLSKDVFFAVNVLVLVCLVKADSDADITTYPKMEEYVASFGYPIESYDIETKDGYFLKIHRIPYGRHSQNTTNRPPVILMHGLFGCSENYIMNGPKGSLSFEAADAGYDVWLPNVRGSMHSLGHRTLDSKKRDSLYWDFSWHEMGIYDLPATIDLILNNTDHDKIAYVGHSQGGAVFLVMATDLPEYKEKISVFIALSPALLFNHCKHPLLLELMDIDGPPMWEGFQLVKERKNILYVDYDEIRLIIATIAKQFPSILPSIVTYIFGESEQIDLKQLIQFSGIFPAGGSVKQLEHFIQVREAKSFVHFDYGPEENLKRYNSTKPPKYDLKSMDLPTYIYAGQNDIFVAVQDLHEIADILPNVKEFYVIPVKKFTHLDFIAARNLKNLVNDRVIRTLDHYIHT
ncbi:unnamed protein product [Brassicogethes aeneus]|uniref:Lipase n=1 Tax=Brassicogethes aeneus TaxID=1431903 RepID=A0A9P0ASV6_BRAAE|nr:unnamed protein product [Brassicogethes aeneus]